MSEDIKDQLIRLGENNPGLREDIRPVLDRLTGKSKTAAAQVGKCSIGTTPAFIRMEGLDELSGVMRGLCEIDNLEWNIQPGLCYVDVYVAWQDRPSKADLEGMKADLLTRVKSTKWGKHVSRMGVHAHMQGASFTLDL